MVSISILAFGCAYSPLPTPPDFDFMAFCSILASRSPGHPNQKNFKEGNSMPWCALRCKNQRFPPLLRQKLTRRFPAQTYSYGFLSWPILANVPTCTSVYAANCCEEEIWSSLDKRSVPVENTASFWVNCFQSPSWKGLLHKKWCG